MLIAIATGVPIGVYISRHPTAASIVLYLSSIMITIPSIALFGFMMPILSSIDKAWDAVSGIGIGTVPAVIALALYSQLPIIRNTYIAIKNVDPATIEAGRGMGMTHFQLLIQLQLPLAAPVIMAATSSAGSSTLTVTFSEPVDTSNAGAGDLVVADFTYTDVSATGASSIASMGADADGTDSSVTLTADVALVAGDFATDTLAAAAAQIYDLADNAAATTSLTITNTDVTAPSITGRITADLDGDGYIDAVQITFDEPILDTSVTATDFDIGGIAGEAFSSTTAAATCVVYLN